MTESAVRRIEIFILAFIALALPIVGMVLNEPGAAWIGGVALGGLLGRFG